MDGIQTAEILRRELDLPVIFLSAHSDEPTLQRAKVAAPYGFLVKPFDERELQIVGDIAFSGGVGDHIGRHGALFVVGGIPQDVTQFRQHSFHSCLQYSGARRANVLGAVRAHC